jgi:tetratricopeptide (TPR) repeat protein
MVPNSTVPNKAHKIAIYLLILIVSLWLTGCTSGLSGASPKADSYYYFLRAQYEELNLKDTEAVNSMVKAVEADETSTYLKIETAKLLSRAGRVDEAVSFVEKVIASDPDNVDARLLNAWMAAGNANWSLAEDQYREVLRIDPVNEEALSYLGALYAENGRLDEATSMFTRLAKQIPQNYLPDYYLGRLAKVQENNKLAINYFKSSLKKNSSFVPSLAELALIYEQENRLKEAEATYRQLIILQPGSSVPQARLAYILLKTGRKSQAVEILKQLSRSFPNSSDEAQTSIVIALAYIEQGMLKEAADELEEALLQYPSNDSIKYILASIISELGNHDRAAILLEGVSPESEYYVESRLLLCTILILQNNREAAITMLAKARTEVPSSPKLLLAHGVLYEEVANFKQARELYVNSLANFPKEAEVYFRLAFVEDKLGDKTACIKAMQRTIEIDPNHAEALNYLAYTWAELNQNLDEALKFALKANYLKPNNGYIVDTLAWIYYRMGDTNKSLPLLEHAAKISDDNPVILEHLGDVLVKVGRETEARRIYAKALEKGHDQPGVINEKLQSIDN